MFFHTAGDHVGERKQISAAVVINDAFWIAGGTRGVVERDGVPFVLRHQPSEIGVAFAQKILIFEFAEPFAGASEFRIVVVDDEWARRAGRERAFDNFGIFAVG